MQVHRHIDQLPIFRNAVITIGTFDGVHRGHRQIIDKLKEEAKNINGETVIITFHPHPRKIVAGAAGIPLINTLEEKIELLEQLGIDHLVVTPFTEAFSSQPALDYISNFLISKFRPHTIIIGYDHRFGKDRTGNYLLLEEMASVYNYQLREIPKHVLDEIAISSTRIREALLNGETEIADKLLGYDFFFEGDVVHGDKLGRQLGYPTANLHIKDEEKIVPGNGIYAVYVEVRNQESEVRSQKSEDRSQRSDPDSYRDKSQNLPDNIFSEPEKTFSKEFSPVTSHVSRLKGMMSIGTRPTVGGTKRVIEVNILDFNQEIYGRSIRVFVKKYLRPELKFESLEDLVKQIDKDKEESLRIL